MAQTQKDIFRKTALDKLSSPEQLDQLVQVVMPAGWLALIALMLLLLIVVIWSIFGSIPTRVNGQGILLSTGGIQDVVSLSEGEILEILVSPGDMVTKDQMVAQISQKSLSDQIVNTKLKLAEVQSFHEQTQLFGTRRLALQKHLLLGQRDNIYQSIKTYEQRCIWLDEKIASYEKLISQGLITRQKLLDTRQERQKLATELDKYQSELQKLSVNELELQTQQENEMTVSQMRKNDLERELNMLEQKLKKDSQVKSPCTGRILEIMRTPGDLVRAGQSILNMEPVNNDQQVLEAIIYVSASDGKKIKPDMSAQITPTLIKRAEYGYILGKIKTVSEYPSTYQGMMRVLSNDNLVQSLMINGAPIALIAEIIRDSGTPSGYKWSSGKGPAIEISSGMLCQVFITVRSQAPVSFLVPMLKQATGVY